MIVNKYSNGGGGSGERGPQGYQGPQGIEGAQGYQGAEGAQGPAGSGSTGDFNNLMAVPAFPESAETGDVVALVSEGSGLPNGVLFEERNDLGENQDKTGGRFQFEIGAFDGIAESDALYVGKVITPNDSEISLYIYENEWKTGGAVLSDLNGNLYISMGVDSDSTGESNIEGAIFNYQYTSSEDEYMVVDIYPEDTGEVTFDIPQGGVEANGVYQYDGTDWVNVGGDNTILKSVSAAPETMELNDVAVLGNNLSQFTGYEDVVSAYTLVKMYNGVFAQDAGAYDYVNVRVTGNTTSVFTIGGSYIHTPLGNITPGSEVYTDWTDVTEYGGVSTGIMMKYDAGNDELDLKVPSGFSVEGQIVNKSGAELGDLSTYVVMTSEEEHFQGDPIYEQYAKRSELSDLSAYWTSAETQTAIQNASAQLATQIPVSVSQLTNDEEFVSSANLKTINNESIVGTGNISIQGGGDSHILKSSSGAPANLGAGDVYAITIPSADTIYGTTWTDTGERNIEYDRYGNGNPQAIRINTTGPRFPGVRFHWACEEYGSDTYMSFEDDAITFENGDGWTEISSTHYVFDGWSHLTEGKCIHLEYLNDYFYFYTEDGSQIWIWEVTDNISGNDVFEGEVTPGHGEYNYLYQAISKLEPNVKIELEGNARVDGTLDDPEQVVTMSDGQMKISFYDNSNIQGVICDLESNGTYFHLYYDSTTDAWTLYDSDGENILIKITDGESDSADFGDGNVYLSYSGGVLTAYTDNEKGWQNWNMGDSHEGFAAQEFAKVSDLPTDAQLLPWVGVDIHNGCVLRIDSNKPTWINQTDVVRDVLLNFNGEYVNGSTMIYKDYDIIWAKPEPITKISAVSAIPATTTDGDVIPYANASGYGIVQAQSGTSGYAWVEGNTEMTGNTQIRVPYTSNDSGYIEFTFENSTDYHNLWWHYDDGNEPHWDGDNVPIDEQVDGEFSGQDGDGETITCVRSGDYLVVTFGSPVVSVNNVYNTEVYTETFLPAYKEVAFKEEVVTSTDIKRMVKISQADYTALAVKDPETMYVIIG